MEDDVKAPYGVDLDGDVGMEWDGDNDEDDEEEADKLELEVNEDDEQDEDEHNGNEPHMTSKGKMVNPSTDYADTMADDQLTMLTEQDLDMRDHSAWPQPLASAPPPQTPETYNITWLEFLGLVTPQKPRPTAATLREAVAAGNISDVDVEQQLLCELAGDDSVPEFRRPDVPLPNVSGPDVLLPDVPLPDVPLLDACPAGSVGADSTSRHSAEQACVAVSVEFLSCEIHLP